MNATLRPPVPNFANFRWADPTHFAFAFNAQSNLDYVIQSRDSLATGSWSKLQDLLSAPTDRTVNFTNLGAPSSRFYRLKVGP